SLIITAPGMDIIAIEKNLPKMPVNKLLKALPFAIEDQLLEPIDNYHIVITQIQDNGNVTLLAVLKSKMQQWLQPFQKRITINTMLPDYLFLPYEKDTWHIAIEKQVLIRTDKYLGLCCDLENWQQMLTLLWQAHTVETQPKILVIHRYSPSPCEEETMVEESLSSLPSPICKENEEIQSMSSERAVKHVTTTYLDTSALNHIPVTIEQRIETTTLLQDMAKQAQLENLTANLLQASFTQEHHLSPVKKTWLLTSYMLTAAIIVSLLTTITQFVILKHQDNILQTQISTIYKQIYPQATEVVAPQVRMERTLKEIQNNQSGGGYLGLLATTGQVFKQLPAIQINTLRFQDKNLVLEVQGNSFDALDLALNKLNQSGVMAKQDQGATKNNQVTARFTIQERS
ncbi:MAG: type II secretion system protein GspL, partial [Gammaproteobacteria bacterium]